MTWAMVIVGAMVGAPLRYTVDRVVQSRHDTGFPWGTFSANMLGCAILGFLVGATTVTAVPESLQALVGVGLAGALSTYSTFSFETLRLAETGSRRFAATNAGVSVVAGLGTAVLAAALAVASFA
ncbi:fluoride efflux transporter FluC [Nocardioides acrostichi]|uniref:Fluoride-specific ion channel FluC n=1 Tax=Nocardioides acrostichi TaxID=2784339 RepID=A0A930V0H3_9ACTN|nr:CrcB family protein [Nocardioides acrostichi]MBF4161611.1 CrcB family protein [Nocardioides acrostichi]